MNGTQHSESPSLRNASWLGIGTPGHLIDDGRPFVVVPGCIERVWTEACSDDLPCFATWKDDRDFEWKRFELPASAKQADTTDENGVCEETRLVFASRSTFDAELGVALRFQLPRLARNDQSDNDPSADGQEKRVRTRWIEASETVEDLVDRHIDLVSGLFDSVPVTSVQWQGNIQGVAFRSSNELASRWHRSAVSGEPRMALIVRLARTLPELLARTCNRPRHTLRRERQLKFIGQIQEIDSSCLRWLARQPGTTVAEKAGVKQMAMAVVRVEDVDTPENRVVRDLLIRGAYACDRYLREHRSASEHPRVVHVKRFRHLLRELLFTTRIADAAKLVGIPQPNYVLQHDPRYQVLWQAYIQLVRQQMLEDSVWRWRHRLFAEHFTICLIAALEEFADPQQQQQRGDVLIQLEQNAGQFIDTRTTLGSWCLKNREYDNVDLVLGHQLRQHPLIPERLAAIGPDAVLVRSSSTGQPWLAAFWTLLDFDLAQDLLDDRVLSLSEAIERLDGDAPQRALLIQPVISNGTGEAARFVDLEKSRGLRIGLPLQHHFGQIVEHVKWTLGLN
jgi:hypothetical protein